MVQTELPLGSLFSLEGFGSLSLYMHFIIFSILFYHFSIPFYVIFCLLYHCLYLILSFHYRFTYFFNHLSVFSEIISGFSFNSLFVTSYSLLTSPYHINKLSLPIVRQSRSFVPLSVFNFILSLQIHILFQSLKCIQWDNKWFFLQFFICDVI